MKSSIKSAVVFGSTVTALSSGALGAFTLAHSSTILAACVGEASAISMAAAANRLRFMNILLSDLVRAPRAGIMRSRDGLCQNPDDAPGLMKHRRSVQYCIRWLRPI